MNNALPTRTLGKTELEVTQLGYGTAIAELMRTPIGDKHAEKLLNTVLDEGINFIDTAPDYGVSEDQIGKFISHRRDEFYLATKCGCVGDTWTPGHNWTSKQLLSNIDSSLRRMKTDQVDILQMHNPTVEDVLENGLIDTLQEIRAAGKTRFIGVSSGSPDLVQFADMGIFDVFQIPYSALERRHETMITHAANQGAGIIIRGGIAQGDNNTKTLDKVNNTWNRALENITGEIARHEFVLRFTLTHPSCHTTIVGTGKLDHLSTNIQSALTGPLNVDLYETAKQRLTDSGETPE